MISIDSIEICYLVMHFDKLYCHLVTTRQRKENQSILFRVIIETKTDIIQVNKQDVDDQMSFLIE